MKALCRGCRIVGPTVESVNESKAAAEAARWHYTRRGGFLCPDCYFDDINRRLDRSYRWAVGLVVTVGTFHLLAVLLYLAHLIFEA
jgi:hypothetical protein